MVTFATVDNMRIARNNGISAIVYSWETGEEYSADPGDYFFITDQDYVLKDGAGCAMYLIYRETIVRDALTGERV